MTEKPDWLPEMVSVNGSWDEIVKRLYRVFHVDFIQRGCTYEGRSVSWDNRILPDDPYQYEEGFWHLITKMDRNTEERLLDNRRAERLPWCSPTIENSGEVAVVVWDYVEGTGRLRTYLWLKDCDYVIVLEKRRKGAFLVTAFHVSGDSTRRNLQRKFDERQS